MSGDHTRPHPAPGPGSRALTEEALKAQRRGQAEGMSRRQLLRTSLGAAIGLWALELGAGSLAFLWPGRAGGFGGRIRIGTFDELVLANPGLPIAEGFPAYVPGAHAFIALIDTARRQFVPGADPTGDGTALNVRALYQRCPHLGCRPNPCLQSFYLECPCHQSRYDRLGIKRAGAEWGPAPRSMDRFPASVDAAGVLTVDTGRVVLGPLPIALGQPGLIPPRSATGCI